MIEKRSSVIILIIVFCVTIFLIPIQRYVEKKYAEPYPALIAPSFEVIRKVSPEQKATRYSWIGIDADGKSYPLSLDEVIPKTTQSRVTVFLYTFGKKPDLLNDPQVKKWIYNYVSQSHPNIVSLQMTPEIYKNVKGQKPEKISIGKTTTILFNQGK